MAAKWIETITGSLEQKKQYKSAIARIESLPKAHSMTASAVVRYVTYYGGVTDGESLVVMIVDLADLFEAAAADGTPVRQIVGSDPVDFAETFVRSYNSKQWIDKERRRLIESVDEAERAESS